jgi:hypothetical protein
VPRRKSGAVARRALNEGGEPAWQLYQAAFALRVAADEVFLAGDPGAEALLRVHAKRLDARRFRLMSKTRGKALSLIDHAPHSGPSSSG